MKKSTDLCKKLKAVACVLVVMAFIFGLCFDAFFLYNLTSRALSDFIFVGLAVAFTVDTTL